MTRAEPGHGGSASGSGLEPLHHPSFETSLPQITPGFGTGWGAPTHLHTYSAPPGPPKGAQDAVPVGQASPSVAQGGIVRASSVCPLHP